MIDCGEGTQLRCKKFNIKISRIDHIFISHLHGDHYLGLMGLISTMHLYGREKSLLLVGPPGLAEIITLQLRHSETALNFQIDFIEWKQGEQHVVYEDNLITISTIPLEHRVPCSGYLLKEKPKKRRLNKKMIKEELTPADIYLLRDGLDILNEDGGVRYKNSEVTLEALPNISYAYCSDTRYMPELAKQLTGVDMIYHEATFAEDMAERAYQTFHTTAGQAATLARDAGVSKLLLGHFSTRYRDLEVLEKEARAIFKETYLAIEGETFVMPA